MLVIIYNTLIHSHILYGLLLWGFKYGRIEKLQKKAVRVLASSHYIAHTTPIFKHFRILTVKDLYDIQLFKLYYRNTNNVLPPYFQSFIPHVHQHPYNLRRTNINLPMTRKQYFVQCTKYQYLKLLRETSQEKLNRVYTLSLYQFSRQLKLEHIEEYDPNCYIEHCYVCENT